MTYADGGSIRELCIAHPHKLQFFLSIRMIDIPLLHVEEAYDDSPAFRKKLHSAETALAALDVSFLTTSDQPVQRSKTNCQNPL